MANVLQLEIFAHSGRYYDIKPGRISEFETGRREPNLFVLAAYARLAKVHLESVADDHVLVKDFRKRLGKEFDYSRLSRTQTARTREKEQTHYSN